MSDKKSFSETLESLSIEELQDLEQNLRKQYTRQNHNSFVSKESLDVLYEQILAVKNRITSLRIRNQS